MRRMPFWIAVGLLAGFLASVAQAAPLRVDLEPGDSQGVVKFSITNTSDASISVLRWDTPLEGRLSSDVFRLQPRLKGWPVVALAPYIGREIKRAAPDTDQYLILRPGETVGRDVELNDYYRIEQTGPWNVRFLGQIRHVSLQDAAQGLLKRKAPDSTGLDIATHESNSVALSMVSVDSHRARTPAFNNCSLQQQADIVAATQLAEQYASIAIEDLRSLDLPQRITSPRYITWFGAYDETRFDQVFSNYQTIATVLESEEIRFDCGCDEAGVFAYVLPASPYDIFLCPQFRAASIAGTDSRAGTIIHELTHFNNVAATDDHVYSQRGAQNLASADPATAITNADSYEYFAENTPELSIVGTATASNSPESVVLALNTPVTGSVEAGASVTYQVSDASQIQLSSTSGDADLYLYSDAALVVETCSSVSATAQDVCESFVDGQIYVRAYGYTAATYTLVANGRRAEIPESPSAAPLVPGTIEFGLLQQGERAIYQVSEASQIVLESLTGDADLYVFDSLDFLDTTLVCAAEAYSADSIIDRCALPIFSKTYYLLVVGFEASDYSLYASIADALPANDDPATLSSSAAFAPFASSGGGGGAFDWWIIGLLMAACARCHSVWKRRSW